jgi:hypothetical protein
MKLDCKRQSWKDKSTCCGAAILGGDKVWLFIEKKDILLNLLWTNIILKRERILNRIAKHKGILYKVSKMYMDNHDDQQDLFQEIVCQLGNRMILKRKSFSTDVSSGYQYSNCVFKERKRKSINTRSYLKTLKKKRMIQIKESQIEHFTKQFKN